MAFRSSAKANATSGNVTATPPGVQAHDYLAAILSHDSGSTTGATGWNQIDQLNYGPDNQVSTLFDKYDATGSDSFQFSSNTSFGIGLICAAWSGRDNSAPRSAPPVRTADGTERTSPISISLTGITAQAGDDLAVFMGMDQTHGDARWTFSEITNFTERQDGVNEEWASGINMQTRDNVSAGATGSLATTATRSSGTGQGAWCGWVMAIKASGGGGSTVTGTGAVTLDAISVSGTGVRTSKGSGSVSISAAEVSGTGNVTRKGTGSVLLSAAEVSGAGARTSKGSGSVSLSATEVSGSGAVGGALSGSGSVVITEVTVSGSGSITKLATGNVQIADILVAASGVVSRIASGSVVVEAVTVAGSGTSQEDVYSGTGEVILTPVLVAGSGIRTSTGAGDVILAGVLVSGQSEGFALPGYADLIVYEISPSGEVQWVDYIPVKYRSPDQSRVNRYDDLGALGVMTLGSDSGLVPWVDYVPVLIVTGDESKVWRTDDDGGFIPLMEVDED